MKLGKLLLPFLTSLLVLPAVSQNLAPNPAASAPTAVPPLVPYSGVVGAVAGQSTNASVTFLIYREEQGGDPLFSETQSVAVDVTGRFKTQIGATLTNGLPIDLFASGEARWLAVQIAGEPAQPRVLLASVPYALKAADAATLGGLPASAYALAGTKSFATAALTPEVTSTTGTAVTTLGGFSGYLPVFNSSSSIVNSTIFQNSNGVGINGFPYAALDVTGRTIFRGTMVVSRAGNATATAGYGSVPLQFFANGWNSTINGPVQPVMQWQAEATGNNTAAPGATLNLLYNNGTVLNAVETGLYFNANGTIHFAPGQTFPGGGGGGGGTITGVTAGTALTGGGTSGNVTLNVDTTKVALLTEANKFSGDNIFSGTQIFSQLGVGTATPRSIVELAANASSALGPALTLTNTAGGEGASASIDFNTYYHPGVPYTSPTARIAAVDDNDFGNSLQFSSQKDGVINLMQLNMLLPSTGGVIAYGQPETLYALEGIAATGENGYGEVGVYGVGGDGINTGNGGPGAFFIGGAASGTSGHSSIPVGGTGAVFQGGTAPNSVGGDGIYVTAGTGVYLSGNGFAGYIVGDVRVTGTMSAATKDFRIDHPLDPANKYLVHSSVESSEMVNIYSGNVVTDELGLATVQLPDWFEAENGDFRYQLTTIGRQAQAWIAEEVGHGQFKIATNATRVKVSWQITAVRQDAYAKANPLVVEPPKPAGERGFYQNPELFGQPAEKQTEWGRHPQQMQRLKEARDKQTLKAENAITR